MSGNRKKRRVKVSQKSLDNLRPFKKGKDARRIGNGRKPSMIKDLQKLLKIDDLEGTLTRDDYKKIGSYLLEQSIEQLQKLMKQTNVPVFIKVMIQAIKKSLAKGDFYILKDMIDDFVGSREEQENIQAGVQISINTGFDRFGQQMEEKFNSQLEKSQEQSNEDDLDDDSDEYEDD